LILISSLKNQADELIGEEDGKSKKNDLEIERALTQTRDFI